MFVILPCCLITSKNLHFFENLFKILNLYLAYIWFCLVSYMIILFQFEIRESRLRFVDVGTSSSYSHKEVYITYIAVLNLVNCGLSTS